MTDTYTHSSEIIVDRPVIPDDERPPFPDDFVRHAERGIYSDEPWIPHGTVAGYSYHRCSCEPCRQANMRVQKRYELRRRERDGLPAPTQQRQSPRAATTRAADLLVDLIMSYTPDLYVSVIGEADNYDDGVQQLVELIREESPETWADVERHVLWERNYPVRALAPLESDSGEFVLPLWPDAGRLLGMTRERTLEAVQRRELPVVLVDGELCVLGREVAARLQPIVADVEPEPAEPVAAEPVAGHEHVDTLRGAQLSLDDDDVTAIAVPLWPDAGQQLGLSRSSTYKRAAEGQLLVCEIDGKRMVTLAEIERQRAAS